MSRSRTGLSGRLAAVIWMSLSLFACADRDDDDEESIGQKNTALSGQPGQVTITAEAQKLLGLQVETLSAASWRQESRGYGRVLDPAPLAALVGELQTAQSALAASERERDRLRQLQRDDNASVRAVEEAEAAAVRDQWLAQSARDRIALSWGQSLAERRDLPALLRTLTEQSREIVRIELPPGEPMPETKSAVRIADSTDERRSMEAQWIGMAPSADAQLQGRGLLYLTRDNSLGLTIDASIAAFLPLSGEPLQGVRVPADALIRYAAQPWVYVQTTDTTFERTALPALHPMPDGWIVPSGLKAGTRVVTRGAQVLLSEELKGQVRLGD